MFDAHTTTLYVDNLETSTAFYKRLLGRDPVSFSPTFTVFFQESGARIALWARARVEPEATPPGGFELSFFAPSSEAVDEIHGQWKALGITIVKEPWSTAFAYSLVAADPDGHRLRVYWPLGAGGG